MEEKKKKVKSTPAVELYGWAQSFLFAILLLIITSSFIVRISGVSGTSMLDTLQNQDRVLVSLIGNRYDKGDIIVCTAPDFSTEPIVKRIIAMAGDTVEVYAGGHVFVNGEELYEPYVYDMDFNGGQALSYPYTVPEGHIFVMGDNRPISADSRYYSIGPIDLDNIIGKVFFRVWPLNSLGGID